MQQDLKDKDVLDKIEYYVGDADIIRNMSRIPVKSLFAEDVCCFLNDVSKCILNSKKAEAYPDVITLAFWMRKASIEALKKRFVSDAEDICMGRGVAFHIAPSNVAVNYAYSLVMGLLTGNANIVRMPSKHFEQIDIINQAISEVLEVHKEIKKYICLVRYERNKEINDVLSAMADIRIIWGGNTTIDEIRQSSLAPRATEITFADRYSLAVIDSDVYLEHTDKDKIAQDFYNDTYLTDQNACTSPKLVVWRGKRKEEAKQIFWSKLHILIKDKYQYQPVMGVNKLTSTYLACNLSEGSKIVRQDDNLITLVEVSKIDKKLLEIHEATGFFMQYDCDDIMELSELCNDVRVQTIGYLGNAEDIKKLVTSGIKGVDRVVPIGKTMAFDLLWDGYNLAERFTRKINFIF